MHFAIDYVAITNHVLNYIEVRGIQNGSVVMLNTTQRQIYMTLTLIYHKQAKHQLNLYNNFL